MSRRLQSTVPLAAACGATAWLLAYRGAPTAFDEWLALPIAIESAHPGTFPSGDLLVQGSMQGPFHLYKLSGVLYRLGLDIDVVWYVLLALSLVVFFLCAWRVARAMGLDLAERTLLVLAIAATPIYRGTLNWSAQPMLSFISASVGVPLGLMALASVLEDRPRRALVYAALAFDVHPSIGLCAGLAVLSVVAWRGPERVRLSAWITAGLVAIPNLAYLLLHRPPADTGSDAQLWSIFQVFGYHTFIRDHFRQGYPWFALALALALVGATQLGTTRALRARRLMLVLTGAAATWILLMNFAPVPALMPLYLIRASLLAKPLLLGLALTAFTRRGYAGKYGFLAPVAAVVAVAHPDLFIAEAVLAIVLGAALHPSPDRRLSLVGTAAWMCGQLMLFVTITTHVPMLNLFREVRVPLRLATFAVGVIASGLLLVLRPAAEGIARTRRAPLVLPLAVALPVIAVMLGTPAGRGWLPESAAKLSERFHLSRPLPKESGAMRWAETSSPPGSLFAIPPVDHNWLRFRVVARRGAYVTVHDINQLMYVPSFVFPAVERLAALGVVMRRPHNFDQGPYLHPTCARMRRLARDGVGFYVLPVDSSDQPDESVFAYRDADYSILDVRRTVQACAPSQLTPGEG